MRQGLEERTRAAFVDLGTLTALSTSGLTLSGLAKL